MNSKINIIYTKGKWKVKRSSAKRADSAHPQERLAIWRAQWIARTTKEDIYVHNRDGSINRIIEAI